MRMRRTFRREFKREAACLVLDQGYSVRDVCTQLDLQEGALRRWVQLVRFERNGGVPETAALTPEQQEIQALKARISKLEREKITLKKATVDSISQRTSARGRPQCAS